MTSAAQTRPAPRRTLRRGLRVIATGFGEQRKVLAVAVLGSAIYGVMTVAMARVIAHLVSSIVEPAVAARSISGGQVWTIVWQMTLAVLLTVVGVVLRRVGAGIAFFNLNASYRRRVTRQYLRLPLAWHHRHPSGQLLSNANADVEATWNVFQPLPMAIGVLVMLAVGSVEMFRVDLWLALIGMLVFPALFVANLVFQSRMSPRVTLAQQLRAEVSEVAHESLEAGLLVKAMGREEQETARFAEVTNRLRVAAVEVGRTRGTFDPVIEAIPTFGTLAVLAVGTARVSSGDLDAASVVQIAYLFSVLAFPVRSFGWVLAELPRTVNGWDRVAGVLRARGEMTYGDQPLPFDGQGAVGLEGVSYAYDVAERSDLGREGVTGSESAPTERVTAVRDVTIEIPPGQTTALVGPTGSGKSTLVNMVLRLVDPTGGVVEIDGRDLREVRQGGVPEVATLVAQETFLFDDTVEGNVTLGRDADETDVEDALRVAQASKFVAELSDGAQTRVGERGASLSGGQRQRIALARAVIRRPRLLVLDDATSAVDPAIETAILDGLRERSDGMTVLVVAYRKSTIGMADRVAYIERGRVLDQGTHSELMDRCEGYRRLVTAYTREAEERAAVAADEEAS
ncbi:ABC transporter ATP-binding protein [Luteipulveratus mongoliensis]|uniref:ABC transporter permease n=1 Tax=Luteipulveratus mongoliensis TaxID=571913 RepID=A0A0K1JJ53_9MICO|nr:ABC transporter ATP-binding protein [Luteipulveratus mongoliensis]AKU16744.1 ABC transporter permease [Luteipulveratus mongoliensis]